MEQLSWAEIEPRYVELAATPLSRDTLPVWLAQWSRLSDLLEESQVRLWIESPSTSAQCAPRWTR